MWRARSGYLLSERKEPTILLVPFVVSLRPEWVHAEDRIAPRALWQISDPATRAKQGLANAKDGNSHEQQSQKQHGLNFV